MRYHVVLSRFIDLNVLTQEADSGLRPRHALKRLADRLNASIHAPGGQTPNRSDKILGKLVGTPLLWAFARDLAGKLREDDILFCPDESIGLPLAYLCSRMGSRPKVVVMVHNVDRPRTRLALKLSPGIRSGCLFVSVSQRQLDFLNGTMGVDKRRTVFVADQTDINFFHPGPQSYGKTRPLVVSAGLERRDYKILADAAGDLDLDVAVTGFSADAASDTSSFPETWPSNFTRRRYEWRELAQLYRNADVVVVTLLPNIYAAGITSMIEGMASGRPVIITETEGLKGYLDDEDALTLVEQGDVFGLQRAIKMVLEDQGLAQSRGRRAAEIARARYASSTFVDAIATIMETPEPVWAEPSTTKRNKGF